MKQILLFVLAFFSFQSYGQAPDLNMELVAHVDFVEQGSDIWGYVDQKGIEYAVIGTKNGTRVYSLADPRNPVLKIKVDGDSSTWRDIKSYKDRIYVTTDTGSNVDEGLLIINMSDPDNITYKNWTPRLTISGISDVLRTCHNLYMDEDEGFLYLAGCNISQGGAIILDLNKDLDNPVFVGAADREYAHDVFVKDNILYTSEINIGEFGIYDVTDKSNPVYKGGAVTTTTFTHNAWTDDENNILFTTDEKANAFVDSYDVTDPANPILLDKYQPIETANRGVIPHNTHYKDGYIYTSWYTDGVKITDVHDPTNMIEVGSYDTYDGADGGFSGCWGAYPFLPSGVVLASDLQSGLYVLKPTLKRASYIKGFVTSLNTGEVINNVKVEILGGKENLETTKADGSFKTGLAAEGQFKVRFSHSNFDTEEVTVNLVPGEYQTLDVKLGSLLVEGSVKDESNAEVDNVKVVVENEEGLLSEVTSDENGAFSLNVSSNQDYNGYILKWGYLPAPFTIENGVVSNTDFVLTKGYRDDFVTDLGWTSSGTARTGHWEIAKPVEALYGSTIVSTEGDISTDFGNTCLVTEQNTTQLGANDIDYGTVVVTSPSMDFSGGESATINFDYFYTFILNGSTPFDDAFKVSITNGTITHTIFSTEDATTKFVNKSFVVKKSHLAFTGDMKLIVTASDNGTQQFTEAQFDGLSVEVSTVSSVEDEALASSISIYPNPVEDYVSVSSDQEIDNIQVLSVDGRIILEKKYKEILDVSNLDKGLYIIKLEGVNGAVSTHQMIKK